MPPIILFSPPYGCTNSNESDGLDFTTEAAINPSATLSALKREAGGLNSNTYGYPPGSFYIGTTDALNFSTEGSSLLGNTLSVGRSLLAGVSSK